MSGFPIIAKRDGSVLKSSRGRGKFRSFPEFCNCLESCLTVKTVAGPTTTTPRGKKPPGGPPQGDATRGKNPTQRSFVHLYSRDNPRRLMRRRSCPSDEVFPGSSLGPAFLHPGRSAWVSCRSSTSQSGPSHCCTEPSRRPGLPVVRPGL